MSGISLACVSCKGVLDDSPAALTCALCGATYPRLHGILDMRPGIQPRQREREFTSAARVLEMPEGTFNEVLEAFIRMTEKDYVVEHELHYELGWWERACNTFHRLEGMSHDSRIPIPSGDYLDIGCGKGSLLKKALLHYDQCFGLDYVPQYVALAKRLLNELAKQGLLQNKRMEVFCGDAESLPFRDRQFSLVTMLDLVEHVPHPRIALSEASRMLAPTGVLYVNSPNRYNIFTPEDHVRIPLLGFVPRRWQKRVVELIRNTRYDRVNLLSVVELIELFNELAPGKVYVDGLRMDGHHSSSIKQFLNAHRKFLQAINRLFFYVIPSHNIIYSYTATVSDTK